MLCSKVIYLYAEYTPFWAAMFNFCMYEAAPLSIGLGLFNLIPIPPLDGSKVAAVLLPDRTYAVFLRYERYGFLLLVFLAWRGLMDGFISRAIMGTYSVLFNLFY
jgi:Zn-dependent protease